MKETEYRDLLGDLGRMLRAGLPIRESLASLGDARRPEQPVGVVRRRLAARDVVAGLRARIEDGATLAEAAADFPHDIPRTDAALIRAGEEGGTLPATLESIADAIDHRRALREAHGGEIKWSLVTLYAAIVLLPLASVASDGWLSYLAIEIPLLAAVGLVILVIRVGPKLAPESSSFRESAEKWYLRIPVWGRLAAKLELARLFDALGRLLAAGVPLSGGVPLAAETVRWLRLRRRILAVSGELEAGSSVADALRPLDAELSGGSWRARIAAGEAAGKLDAAFVDVARGWEEDYRRGMRRVMRWIPIVMTLVVGAFVLWFALGLVERLTSLL